MEEADHDQRDAFMLDLIRNMSMEDYKSNENEKKRIIEHFRRYKPICSFCKLRDGCKFRFMNNPKTLQPRYQPRYQCHICNKHFTFGGRKHCNTPSSSQAKKRKHEDEEEEEEEEKEEAEDIALTNLSLDLLYTYTNRSSVIGSFVHLPCATQKSNPTSSGQAREHEGNAILGIYEHESGLIQVRFNHPPESSVGKPNENRNLEIKEEGESLLNLENETGFKEEEFGFMQLQVTRPPASSVDKPVVDKPDENTNLQINEEVESWLNLKNNI